MKKENSIRILLAEDEESLMDAIKLNLELEGYEVIGTGNGIETLSTYKHQHFDLIILDVMMPGIDGFKVCEQIRLSDQTTPIIFLTAKDTTDDRIHGLKIGADDYINKPFSLEELLLRVKNVLKRNHPLLKESIHQYEFDKFWINFKDYKAKGLNGIIDLTKKEVMLLKLLVERRNEVVSRQEILQAVWGYDVFPSTRTIDNFILFLRKYFEENPRKPKFFKSVRGVGYKFEYPPSS